ncbi:MAG: CHAT domain-containing protein [Halobacteriota archaeon]
MDLRYTDVNNASLLRRAFMLAGANTLVMSLWAVRDEATKELMIDSHTRILAGEGRADALRNAQLAIKEKHPDPYYWGAFICQGDPRPLKPNAARLVIKIPYKTGGFNDTR